VFYFQNLHNNRQQTGNELARAMISSDLLPYVTKASICFAAVKNCSRKFVSFNLLQFEKGQTRTLLLKFLDYG